LHRPALSRRRAVQRRLIAGFVRVPRAGQGTASLRNPADRHARTARSRGRAFGTPVTGAWDWNNGYFCRDLFFGEDDLGFNCQLVQVNGETLRFTSDQGQGIYADLTLR
jgi:hypothetical protein